MRWLLVLSLAAADPSAAWAAEVLAVHGPRGPAEQLQAWIESPDAPFAALPTHQGQDGRWRLEPGDTAGRPPHSLWLRGKGTAFAVTPWPPPARVELPPPGTLQLTLTTPDPDHPLPATLTVRLSWTASPGASPREVPSSAFDVQWTAASGSLRLEGLPFGPDQRFDVELASPGHAAVQLAQVDLWTPERCLGKVALPPAGRVCGTVDIPDGVAEQEDVEIQLTWGEQRRRVRPAHGGGFCFAGAPLAVLATVQAASRFRTGAPVEVRVPAENVSLALPPLDILAGEVMTADGRAVEDCQVSIVPDPGTAPPPQLAERLASLAMQVSCAGGRFHTPRPWPLTALLLEVTAPPHPPRRLHLGEEESGEGLKVVLATGQRVEGRVRDGERGGPVAHAKVTLACPGGAPVAGTSDEEGRFTLTGVGPAGRCEGRVEHALFPPVREAVAVATAEATLWEVRLYPGVQVSGVTLAAPEGEPVAGALVRFAGPDGAHVTTTSDRHGRFRSDPLAAGVWGVLVEHEGRIAAAAELAVAPPAQPPPLTLWLEMGVEVLGTVEGLTPPGVGAVVTLGGEGARRSRTTTGYGGVFRARGVAAGWTRFTVRHASLAAPCAGKVWIPPLSPPPVTLSCAPPSVSLQVDLRDAGGRPAAAALLVVGVDGDTRTYLCEVDTDGTCRISLIPGTYRVLLGRGGAVEQLWQGPVLADRRLELALPPAAP